MVINLSPLIEICLRLCKRPKMAAVEHFSLE